MEPTDQEMYHQLLGYLAAEGAIEEDQDAGVVVLTEFDHRAVDPPLRLHLTPRYFGRTCRPFTRTGERTAGAGQPTGRTPVSRSP